MNLSLESSLLSLLHGISKCVRSNSFVLQLPFYLLPFCLFSEFVHLLFLANNPFFSSSFFFYFLFLCFLFFLFPFFFLFFFSLSMNRLMRASLIDKSLPSSSGGNSCTVSWCCCGTPTSLVL
ncbi:hypothetical protein WN944_011527 [Citrus x changshan-huyou]|uniref:Uncharacterized protein n=1 Tax=Citrus x changshan-huyou TaxID=2935761 RepID=A0AAP0MW78_9ROSI